MGSSAKRGSCSQPLVTAAMAAEQGAMAVQGPKDSTNFAFKAALPLPLRACLLLSLSISLMSLTSATTSRRESDEKRWVALIGDG